MRLRVAAGRFGLAAVGAALVGACAAGAGGTPSTLASSPDYRACSRAAVTDKDHGGCLMDATSRMETELDRVRERIAARLEPDARQSFGEAHQLWIRYREAECSARYLDEEPATFKDIVYGKCFYDVTLARLTVLRSEQARLE